MRKIARIVEVGDVSEIPKAARIEVAKIGGWPVVIPKNSFSKGDRAVFLEIDCFLAEGNPHWAHLMDPVHMTKVNEVPGRVLKAVVLKGQPSQGLLIPITALPLEAQLMELGSDVSALLGVFKYEKPIPADLLDKAEGYRPGLIPSTSLERIQNLPDEFEEWKAQGIEWEVSEKLEGEATSYAFLENKFLACSSEVVFKDAPGVARWATAHKLGLNQSMVGADFILQGELIGPNMEGNHYNLKELQFYAYGFIDIVSRKGYSAEEAAVQAARLGISMVPQVHARYVIPKNMALSDFIEQADGPSAVNPLKRREGLVFSNKRLGLAFKVISSKYLVNAKL